MTATLAGLACMIAAMLAHATLCRWLRPAQYIRAAMLCLLVSMTGGGALVIHSGLFPAADEWLLLHHESPSAGRGRSFGRADVFAEDGRLVASYSQENMIRNIPEGHGGPGDGGRAKY